MTNVQRAFLKVVVSEETTIGISNCKEQFDEHDYSWLKRATITIDGIPVGWFSQEWSEPERKLRQECWICGVYGLRSDYANEAYASMAEIAPNDVAHIIFFATAEKD